MSHVLHARICTDDPARHIAAQCPKQHVHFPQVAAVPCPQGETQTPEYVKHGGGVGGAAHQNGLDKREGARDTPTRITSHVTLKT